ncbi:glycosyltransferase [Salinivibrio sp. ML323]|uniref:MJ1255/VC2487 family glycosyltransferase n=1 Tax=Salinivibrio sp. ML323 TaxID=1909474 RepID=UPI0009860D0B|nr:MJ1255/VC2487 family glycosyltransferase [Salinivibrio sp. ML323]OOE57770.1 glycosyltransferase [Salinivibrio sp. ML323]
MKLLYGVQGTGNGHISRARAMARALAGYDVDVDFVFSGRPAERYFDMAPFGDYRTFTGMSFVSRDGKIDMLATARHNHLAQLRRDIRQLDVSGYDKVISDFEPISAWAARRQGVPSVAISHQAAFSHAVPKHGETLINRMIMRYFAPTDYAIGLHWYHFNQPILPPIIDTTPVDKAVTPPAAERAVLVYLPFESLSAVSELLLRFSQPFICFHPEVNAPYQRENLTLMPLGKESFHTALNQCQGVIANGGFELPSEALSLGKKLLLKPLSGQFEQLSNVATLSQLGLAHSMDSLDASAVREWLQAPKVGAIGYPDVAQALAEWLVKGELSQTRSLFHHLWAQVDYPETVEESILDFNRSSIRMDPHPLRLQRLIR